MPATKPSLKITRSLKAPREKIFRAWTEPEAMKKWFAPNDQFSIPLVEVDLRVRGRYRIDMKSPDGQTHTVAGVYREIRAPDKLVFSWMWEKTENPTETLVTVELYARGLETQLKLTHEMLPSEEQRDKHNQGWMGCLDRLARAL